jgi:hypothetical protein
MFYSKEKTTELVEKAKTNVCSAFGKGENNPNCKFDENDYKMIVSLITPTEGCGMGKDIAMIKANIGNDTYKNYVSSPMFKFDKWKAANTTNDREIRMTSQTKGFPVAGKEGTWCGAISWEVDFK